MNQPHDSSWLRSYLINRYANNPHVQLLKIEVTDIAYGKAVLTMPTLEPVHSNSFGVIHGGAIASLADTTMSAACNSYGRFVVTLEMNINYLRAMPLSGVIRSCGEVIHGGRQTMVAEANIYNEDGALVAKARGTFFVTTTIDKPNK